MKSRYSYTPPKSDEPDHPSSRDYDPQLETRPKRLSTWLDKPAPRLSWFGATMVYLLAALVGHLLVQLWSFLNSSPASRVTTSQSVFESAAPVGVSSPVPTPPMLTSPTSTLITDNQLALIVGALILGVAGTIVVFSLRAYLVERQTWRLRALEARQSAAESEQALRVTVEMLAETDRVGFKVELPPMTTGQVVVVDPFDERSVQRLAKVMRERADAVIVGSS